MLNPVLGRNMGRWAEVYYTNPPEKREQAVQELLRELQAGDLPAHEPQPQVRTAERVFSMIDAAPNYDPTNYDAASSGATIELAPIREARREPPFTLNDGEGRWGNDRSEPAPAWERYRFHAAAGIAIAVLALVFLTTRSVHSSLVGMRPKDAAPAEAASVQAPGTSDAQSKVAAILPPAQNAAIGKTGSPPIAKRTPPADPVTHAIEKPAKAAAAGPGSEELAIAQSYLSGTGGQQRNTAEAVPWLWKSVAKRNTDATLLLSDLYLRGDGVAKNCDQARVLLDAAASKGKQGAVERLRHLPAFGCN